MKKLLTCLALASTLIFIQGCASQKTMIPTGGSRADGTVKLSYDFGMFESPKVDANQGSDVAKQRCAAWGYSGAEAFGGQTKACSDFSFGGCNAWRVTVEYQCTGTPPSKS